MSTQSILKHAVHALSSDNFERGKKWTRRLPPDIKNQLFQEIRTSAIAILSTEKSGEKLFHNLVQHVAFTTLSKKAVLEHYASGLQSIFEHTTSAILLYRRNQEDYGDYFFNKLPPPAKRSVYFFAYVVTKTALQSPTFGGDIFHSPDIPPRARTQILNQCPNFFAIYQYVLRCSQDGNFGEKAFHGHPGFFLPVSYKAKALEHYQLFLRTQFPSVTRLREVAQFYSHRPSEADHCCRNFHREAINTLYYYTWEHVNSQVQDDAFPEAVLANTSVLFFHKEYKIGFLKRYIHETPYDRLPPPDPYSTVQTIPHLGVFGARWTRVGTRHFSDGGIGFINGINNTFADAIATCRLISTIGEGVVVDLVYNATYSPVVDIGEAFLRTFVDGLLNPPAEYLKLVWERFHAAHPGKHYLQICHSQGAIHVKHALSMCSLKIQQIVVVLAIAPAAIIPWNECRSVTHYASRYRDIVPALPYLRLFKTVVAGRITFLDPHPDAELFDHSFDSPTFAGVLQNEIENYIHHHF